MAERWSRQRLRFHHHSAQKKMARLQLKGWRSILAMSIGSLIVFLDSSYLQHNSLFGPQWAGKRNLMADFSDAFLQQFLIGCYCRRYAVYWLQYFWPIPNVSSLHVLNLGAVAVASLGYAVPGTVIAVGVLIPVAWLDNQIDFLSTTWFDYPTGLLISGTIGLLVFAYLVRFLSVALNTVDSGLTAIKPSIDESARSLGATPSRVLSRIHLPILRTSLLTALLLVFVEVLKELPTTLILRPFNFNTLAVRTYELASDERLMDAALPALAIVIIGLLPVLLITKSILNERFSNE